MRSSYVLAVLPALVLARPATQLARRYDPSSIDASSVGSSDLNILNYALTLEHLEAAFYAGGLANFTQDQFNKAGLGGSIYASVQRLSKDEATHVDYLTKALTAAGSTAVPACTYKFPYTDVATFVGLAAVLEGVGVGAYSGAASSVKSGDILTAAASILTIEARHAAIIREAIGELPFPAPFDTPLDFNQVYSLASQFIVSCPFDTPFGLKAFPKLAVSSAAPYAAGQTITLQTPGYMLVGGDETSMKSTKRQTQTIFAAFITVNGPVFASTTRTAQDTYTVTIPTGLAGQNYVVLSSCGEAINDATTIAGPAIVEITG